MTSISRSRRQLAIGLLGLSMILATDAVSLAQTPVQETTVAPPTSAVPIDLTGSWSGHWEDCLSGHSGKMWAEFCKCDDCHYRVVFTGRFFKVFPFRYTVVLNAHQEDTKVLLSGQNDLGRLFGTFTYDGEATATDFVANYSSCRYRGRFVLSRCCCK